MSLALRILHPQTQVSLESLIKRVSAKMPSREENCLTLNGTILTIRKCFFSSGRNLNPRTILEHDWPGPVGT